MAEEEEIEITPEMIDAGVEAWSLFDPGDRLDATLAAIYRAMHGAQKTRGVRLARTPRRFPLEIAAYLSLHTRPQSRNGR